MTAVDFIVPGDIETLTGGYIYDRRVVEGLSERGWKTTVHSLDTSFPAPRRAALDEARAVFAAIPSGRLVVIDGLALGGSAAILRSETNRLRLCALVHHPLALETGLDAAETASLQRAETESLAAVQRVIVTSPWTMRALADYGVSADLDHGRRTRRRPRAAEAQIERRNAALAMRCGTDGPQGTRYPVRCARAAVR